MALAVFVFNLLCNRFFRQDKKALVFSLAALSLIAVSVIYTYLNPNRFVLDLNLTRNAQYLLFLAMGFITILIFDIVEKESYLIAYAFAILFAILKYDDIISIYSCLTMIVLFAIIRAKVIRNKAVKTILIVLLVAMLLPLLYGIYYFFDASAYKFISRLFLLIVFLALTVNYFVCHRNKEAKYETVKRRAFVYLVLLIYLVQFGLYHIRRNHVESSEDGFWRIQRSWEDMQRYVKANTDKDAIIFIPYNMEMCGFRILSEREIVVSYRDCGIIGFDYNAAVEWKKRIDDVEEFRVDMSKNTRKAIQNAIVKYHADYIVFMRFATPKDDNDLLERIYTNTDFALFKVMPHPFLDKIKEKAKNALP